MKFPPTHCKVVRTELPHEAMTREFLEETGVEVKKERWHCFHIEEYSHTNARIYYFAAFGDDVRRVKSVTDEEVKIFSQEDFVFMDDKQIVHNVPYIIGMVIANIKHGYFKMLNPQGVNKR